MRNHPEQYLTVLRQHFAAAPLIINNLSGHNSADIKFQELNTTNQLGKLTAFQRWFSFKEAFAPSFVMGAIERLGYKPKHIIDPFGGSGTTALTAQLLDISATTIEINPFLADLITAKVTPIPADLLRKTSLDFSIKLLATLPDIARLSHLPPTFVEGEGKERWIFPMEVALRISQYLGAIESFSNIKLKRLLKVILGSTLVTVSNVYINGKGRRYRSAWETKQTSAKRFDELFNIQFNIVFEDSLRFESRPNSKVNVYNADSRTTLASINELADLIVFSPPYPNSFDYTDIYNVELWTLGYLTTAKDNTDLRGNTLRSHVQTKRTYDRPSNFSSSFEETYNALVKVRVNLWNRNIPEMVAAYFKDLEDVLVQCYRLLEPDGKVIMVVGDSKYSNVLINVADVLTDLALGIGFTKVDKKEVRKMRASSQQGGDRELVEWIIELSKR